MPFPPRLLQSVKHLTKSVLESYPGGGYSAHKLFSKSAWCNIARTRTKSQQLAGRPTLLCCGVPWVVVRGIVGESQVAPVKFSCKLKVQLGVILSKEHLEGIGVYHDDKCLKNGRDERPRYSGMPNRELEYCNMIWNATKLAQYSRV